MSTTPLNTDAVTAVARALNEAGWSCYEGGMEPGKYDGCEDCQEVCNELARKALTAYLAVAQPVVNSVEELDALPSGAVVREDMGDIQEKFHTVWRSTVGTLRCTSQDLFLPAQVLYLP